MSAMRTATLSARKGWLALRFPLQLSLAFLLGGTLGNATAVHGAAVTSITQQSVVAANAAVPENTTDWLKVVAATTLYDPSATTGSQQVPLQSVQNVVAVASAAYTTTQTQADQRNYAFKGVKCTLDMTVAGASPSVTLEIDGKDATSGKYQALLTGAAVTTVSTNYYRVYPTLTASANAIAQDLLPATWRVKVVANNANSGTYSVGCDLLP